MCILVYMQITRYHLDVYLICQISDSTTLNPLGKMRRQKSLLKKSPDSLFFLRDKSPDSWLVLDYQLQSCRGALPGGGHGSHPVTGASEAGEQDGLYNRDSLS